MTDMLIRAWKDQHFRDSLPHDTLAALPANPAGHIENVDPQVGAAVGGEARTEYLLSLGCCHGFTNACGGFTESAPICTSVCMSVWMTTDMVCALK
ncbi:MAG TPA: mersacidin/lichenicidin family type 2 lantibiotic [Gemmatimonas sp.]|uniref:mersacidin/lichenicidin family type 2 lantibiotic n=1 Tax=Gemmatimonas sp. TaxID=1962908 RepID=UPI002ED843EA